MSRRIRAIVTTEGAGEGVELATDVASALGVGRDGTIRLLDGTGGSTTVRADSEEALDVGEVCLGPDVVDRLDASAGDTVLVEAIDPVVAELVRVTPVPRLSLQGGEEFVRDAVGRRPVSTGDEVDIVFFDGSLTVPFRVTETRPTGPATVDESTVIELGDGPAPATGTERVTPVSADRVGGYERTVAELDAAVVRPLTAGEQYDALGGARRAGVLLTGGNGVGKSHLLGHAVWRANATVHSVDLEALSPRDRDGLRDRLREAGTAASGDGPSVVHLDGLDAFFSGSDGNGGERQLREWIRQFVDAGDVVVVGETRRTDDVPRSLLRGELLAREITVPRPTDHDRAAVLSVILDGTPVSSSIDVDAVGRRAFGYVAADLLALRSRAIEAAVDRAVSDGKRRTRLTEPDVETALAETAPQEIDGARPRIPSTSFEDIGGLEAAKRELTRAVEWPLRHPGLFDQLGIDPVGGVLLYGPPGTGKTMLARAVASTTDANFIPVNGPELMNKYVGESERAVRTVFEQARASAPSVVFLDEVDGLGSARSTDGDGSAPERVVSQLLTEMDGLGGEDSVTVVGATNRPDRLDCALLRPGRFDRLVEVPVPDRAGRAEIFRVHTRDRPVGSLDWDDLAARTEGYTGSDIAAVVREAGLLALEQHLERLDATDGADADLVIRRTHVEEALDLIDPSVSADEREYYDSLGDRLSYSNDRSR